MLAEKKAEFAGLFREFVDSYPPTSQGRSHLLHYGKEREEGNKNFKDILEAESRGEDVTEQVLLKLLPYADTKSNKVTDYWGSIAPAFNCDVRSKYEAIGWTKSKDWPQVAREILRFVRRCYDHPEELKVACDDFLDSPYSKGFQAGTLTPILHALKPDDFILINNKSRSVVNYFSGCSYSSSLADYPTINESARTLVNETSDDMHRFGIFGIRDDDLFDMFTHWLVAIKKYDLKLVSYWIFQSNPDYYDLDGAIRELTEITWTVNQYKKRIHAKDRVYLWESGKDAGILAVATVLSDPDHIPDNNKERKFIRESERFTEKRLQVPLRIDYVLPRRIKRTYLLEDPLLRSLEILTFPNATNFAVNDEHAQILNNLIFNPKNPIYSLVQLADDTGFDLETLERWVRAIRRKGQAVVYGPPGTGKTYIAEHLAKHLIGGGDGFVDLVQFHPAYAYEDFIQGIRPQSDEDGGLSYPLLPGRFLEFCERADSRSGTCVLIIDEINRANLSQVFGELMYLLEYRDRSIPLAGGGALKIPENVLIIGTMNTADRSIALVDHALRRRFAFLRLQPDHDLLRKYHQSRGTGFPIEGLIGVLRRLNDQIDDPHHEVGISFFLLDDLEDEIEDVWRMEIEPYLEEYFFDRPEKAKDFRWDEVRREIMP
ncbi:McrB family protein [Methanocrinis sp.]|uniref:McrB family protein n=1 Tax=Methanocrinis sp. TaxID=3101522 RepID=UPI003D0A7734